MKARLIAAALFGLLLIGCGQSGPADRTINNIASNLSTPGTPPAVGPKIKAAQSVLAERQVAFNEQAGQDDPKAVGGKQPAKVARKIKYTADLKLITDDFDKTRGEIVGLIDKHDGYEALADVSSAPGNPRQGTWRVRIPLEKFGPFREAVRKLAEVENDTVSTEDLTEKYYDMEATIKNLKSEQESWREMLKKTTDRVENLIAVKKELDRVTGEIMRSEGQLRLWANLTELTTVSIHLRERQKYNPEKPPEPVQAATFGMKAGKTFSGSWDALRGFGEGVALLAVGLAPWLPLIALLGIPAWVLLRRLRRRARNNPVAPAPAA